MRIKRIPFLALTLFLALACSNKLTSSLIAKDKSWTTIVSPDNSLPVARHEAAFVGVNSKMYLLGGRGIRAVSIFDLNTQTWTKGAKPPIELHHFQPIVYNEKVYIIGALTGVYPAETPVSVIYIYNTKTDTWSKGDTIPTERLRGSTGNVIQDGIVYISCGIKNGHIDGHQTKLDSYNLKTGEWKILPDAPRSRDHFQAVTTKGKIYILGGRVSKAPNNTFNETIAEVDVYDIKKQKWETLKNPLPNQRAGCMATVFHNEILVIGGESVRQNPAHNEIDALNVETNKWRVFPALVTGRHGTGIVVYNDALYIASGCGNRGGSPELTSMEKY